MTRKNTHEELDKNRIGASVFDGDLFADDVLANSAQTFKILRDLGDVVWDTEHQYVCGCKIQGCPGLFTGGRCPDLRPRCDRE